YNSNVSGASKSGRPARENFREFWAGSLTYRRPRFPRRIWADFLTYPDAQNPGNVFGSQKIRRKIGARSTQSLTYRERQKSGHHTVHFPTYPARQFPRR